jgi:hypothetical protein
MLPIEDKAIVGGGGGGGVVTPGKAKSKVPLVLMATGGSLVMVGAGLHLFWYKPARDDLAETTDRGMYDGKLTDKWSRSRNITIGVYALGGATLLTGLILNFTVFKREESAPQVSVTPTTGGGMLSVGWSR